jgi:hypothetical protein
MKHKINFKTNLIIFDHLFNNAILLNKPHIIKLIRITEDYNGFDPFTFEIMMQLYELYKKKTRVLQLLNKDCLGKKIGNDLFSADIYINIAKFALEIINIYSSWYIKDSDLMLGDYKIKVKGFISNRPIMFSSTEGWDNIMFVDFRNISINKVTVYLINLSNGSRFWKKIKVSTTENINDKYNNNKKFAITFDNLIMQINEKFIFKIYSGTLGDMRLFL